MFRLYLRPIKPESVEMGPRLHFILIYLLIEV